MTTHQDEALINVFPQDNKFKHRYFQLLKQTYVKVYHSDFCKITKELNYLSERKLTYKL